MSTVAWSVLDIADGEYELAVRTVCLPSKTGNKKLDEVYGYVKGHHQWQLGFGLAWVDTSTGYFYHQKVHILDNYSCVIDGKVFKP